MKEIIIIAAMAENRVIGRDNVMPWSIKEDMTRFARLTRGCPCIMGRKTWESLPKKPLPGRLNIIVSRTMTDKAQALSPNSGSVFKSEFFHQGIEHSSDPKEEQISALTPKQSSVSGEEHQNFGDRADSMITQAPNLKLCSSLPAAINFCADYEKIFICGGETIYRQALEFADKIELTVIHKQYEGDAFFPEIDGVGWTVTNTEDFDAFSFITYTKNKKEFE